MNFPMRMHCLVTKVSKYKNEYVHVYASYGYKLQKRGNMSSHVKNFSYNLNVARQNKCCGTVLCNLVSHLSKIQRGRSPSF